MHGDRHVGRDVRHRGVDQVAVKLGELLRIVAAPALALAILRIAQHGDVDLVELQVAAAGVREGAHRLAVGRTQVVEEFLDVGIDLLVDGIAAAPAVEPPTAPGW